MSIPTRDLARTWFEGVWNKKDASVIHRMMAAEARGVSAVGPLIGPDEFHDKVFVPLTTAFPDVAISLDTILVEGDQAAVRWTATASHQGALGPVPPSGRRVRFAGMTWVRFRDGKIVEGSDHFDVTGLGVFLAQGTPCAHVNPA